MELGRTHVSPAIGQRPWVVSVGTTDPWAAAGLALDLFIADRLDIRLLSVVAGVSAQDGRGALSLAGISAEHLRAQFEALGAVRPSAIRIGALLSPAHVFEVVRYIETHPAIVIVDPVFATSAGGRFVNDATREAIVAELLPLTTLVTPNLFEAGELIGGAVRSIGEMDAAALRIADFGVNGVVIKGGHLKDIALDVLWDGKELRHLEAPRLPCDMRGTGCVFALTAAAAFAYGHSLREAVRVARDVVRILLPAARDVGHMRIVP